MSHLEILRNDLRNLRAEYTNLVTEHKKLAARVDALENAKVEATKPEPVKASSR